MLYDKYNLFIVMDEQSRAIRSLVCVVGFRREDVG